MGKEELAERFRIALDRLTLPELEQVMNFVLKLKTPRNQEPDACLPQTTS